jgi:hypothetical protein
MDVVQWLVRRPGDAVVAVVFAAASAERLPATSSLPALRRRSSTLVSDHLPRPFVAAVAAEVVDEAVPTRLPPDAGRVALRLSLRADGDAPLLVDACDVRFAAVLGEYAGVVADLCAAVGLPFVAALPVDARRALELVLGGVGGMSRQRLGDAVVLFAVAARTAALARGFDASCDVVVDGAVVGVVDGRVEELL